ncbi:MAG: isocitrate lyase [Acidobacteriota bacterium]|nr:isocitrate lyase [Acidobacteriota bacterium]
MSPRTPARPSHSDTRPIRTSAFESHPPFRVYWDSTERLPISSQGVKTVETFNRNGNDRLDGSNGHNGNNGNNGHPARTESLLAAWRHDPRWQGIERPYSPADVDRLRGTLPVEHTLARHGAERLWKLFETEPYVSALGAVTGNQAVQQVMAGLQAIYVSGWQVAADANSSGHMYPDLSLYPVDSVPTLVRRINQSLRRADEIRHAEGDDKIDFYVPLVADAEAGFGGPLNAFELMKAMIEAGAAAVHFEDQLSSAKKCGHMGGKVLVPTSEITRKLVAARLAADISGVPAILIARTDANSAKLIRSDVDPGDHRFLTGRRTAEGDFVFRGGLEAAIDRALSYAPYADVIWCETSAPDLGEAREFAQAVHAKFPGKYLAYNCSPSFNWKRKLDDSALARFQQELGQLGYKFQFVTLAGFHSLNLAMFELARAYRERGMEAYSRLQESEFAHETQNGYEAVRHQRFVGAGYFDMLTELFSGGSSSITALDGSTEQEQFAPRPSAPGNGSLAASA